MIGPVASERGHGSTREARRGRPSWPVGWRPEQGEEGIGPMPLKEEVLGQFLGDETFPIEWTSETERLLFWVYDDLHCPKPLSPMFEDIGGWWLSCDHMFRRFGTPFASDWIYKNVNGYLYTAAIPAEAGLVVDTQEYDYRTNPDRASRTMPTRARSAPTSAWCCPSTATTS